MELIEKYKSINKESNKIIYVTTNSHIPKLSHGQICFVYIDNDEEKYSISKQYRVSESRLWNRLMGK